MNTYPRCLLKACSCTCSLLLEKEEHLWGHPVHPLRGRGWNSISLLEISDLGHKYWVASNKCHCRGWKDRSPAKVFSLLTNKMWTDFIRAEQKASYLHELQLTAMERVYGDGFFLYTREPAQTGHKHLMKRPWEELETLHPV